MKKFDTKTQTDRNKEVARLKDEEGWTYRKIASFFGISHSRVRDIYIRQSVLSKQPSGFYGACISATQELNIDERCATRVTLCLDRAHILTKLEPGKHTLSKWSDEELLSIRNFGPRSLEIARLADNIF